MGQTYHLCRDRAFHCMNIYLEVNHLIGSFINRNCYKTSLEIMKRFLTGTILQNNHKIVSEKWVSHKGHHDIVQVCSRWSGSPAPWTALVPACSGAAGTSTGAVGGKTSSTRGTTVGAPGVPMTGKQVVTESTRGVLPTKGNTGFTFWRDCGTAGPLGYIFVAVR